MTPFSVEPIRATRTFEAAIEHLTEAIERARLRPGDRLPAEAELCAQLGISGPTLRQALRVLEHIGVLSVRRGKSGGIFLTTDLIPEVALQSAVALEESAAVDALRARRLLEPAVAHEAAARATREDLEELDRANALLRRHQGERTPVMQADRLFHRALVRAAHNRTVEAAMRGVARGLEPLRDAYRGGLERDRATLDVHERQLDALRRRDRETLDAVLDEHFRMLEESFAAGVGRTWEELFGADARPG